MTTTVERFPLLSASEFDAACKHLVESFETYGVNQHSWLSVEVVDRYSVKYVRITKPLPNIHQNLGDSTTLPGEPNYEDFEDDEELLSTNSTPQMVIEYDIILSPSYQVPVLYFSIIDPNFKLPPTMQTLYQYVIPPQYNEQTRSVGAIGGITVTDHPHTNFPVFFIHPCQTSAVMEASAGENELNPYEYMLMWIGSLGGYVGLNVPLALTSGIKVGSPLPQTTVNSPWMSKNPRMMDE